jgi:bifunctional polynucleotide phosphatase/kinase
MPGMWSELDLLFRQDGIVIGLSLPYLSCQALIHGFPDKSASFFVGDAAGRQYTSNKSDFSSTDRKWALNVGIPFFTPEVRIQAFGMLSN